VSRPAAAYAEAERRADYAQQVALPAALELVSLVREDTRTAHRRLASMSRFKLEAVATALAALVPDDRSAAELLEWVEGPRGGREQVAA
jgi:hypothetical protein